MEPVKAEPGRLKSDFLVRCRGVSVFNRMGVMTVSGEQKAKAKTEQAKGKMKEIAGRAVGNERLTAEGRTEQVKGDAREAKEKLKDTFKH